MKSSSFINIKYIKIFCTTKNYVQVMYSFIRKMKQQTVKDKENEFFHFKNELKLRQTKLSLRICFSLKDLA